MDFLKGISLYKYILLLKTYCDVYTESPTPSPSCKYMYILKTYKNIFFDDERKQPYPHLKRKPLITYPTDTLLNCK